MKTQFETILEGQKKVLDLWSDTAKKMAEGFIPTSAAKSAIKDPWTAWSESMQSYWEEVMKTDSLKDAMDRAPEEMKMWAKAQTEFAEKWMEFYRSNAEKLGFKTPELKAWNNTEWWKDGQKFWNEWLANGKNWTNQDWLKQNPWAANLKIEQFNDLYKAMGQYWQQIEKLIEFGISGWEGLRNYISPKAYEDIINKLMGYKFTGNVEDMVSQVNHFFDKYLDMYKSGSDSGQDWINNWKKMTEEFNSGQLGQSLNTVLVMQKTIKDGLDRIYHLGGNTNEAELARAINDLRYIYTAFLVRNAELQSMVLEASRPALPATLKSYYEEYKENKSIPDYKTFFTRYIHHLENDLVKLMESKEYAITQGELAKANAMIKNKLNQLMELSFKGTPFLMNSFADEVARELASLRKKVRDLENKPQFKATPEAKIIAEKPAIVANKKVAAPTKK